MTKRDVIIGISGGKTQSGSMEAMAARIEETGSAVRLFEDHATRDPMQDIAGIHALIVMGNNFDIDPECYIERYPEGDPRRVIHPQTNNESQHPEGRTRGAYEDAAIKAAMAMKMPLLGVCGGMQRINVLCGGTLHQHVPDMVGHESLLQNYGTDPRVPKHPILIESGTRLSAIAREVSMSFVKSNVPDMAKVIMENTLRHQSIDIIGEGLIASSMSDAIRMPDGSAKYLIESIEADPAGPYGKQFLIGVQWHPEFGASDIGSHIIRHLLDAAHDFAKRKARG